MKPIYEIKEEDIKRVWRENGAVWIHIKQSGIEGFDFDVGLRLEERRAGVSCMLEERQLLKERLQAVNEYFEWTGVEIDLLTKIYKKYDSLLMRMRYWVEERWKQRENPGYAHEIQRRKMSGMQRDGGN